MRSPGAPAQPIPQPYHGHGAPYHGGRHGPAAPGGLSYGRSTSRRRRPCGPRAHRPSRSGSRITATVRRITAAGMGQPLPAACHTAVVRPAVAARAVPGAPAQPIRQPYHGHGAPYHGGGHWPSGPGGLSYGRSTSPPHPAVRFRVHRPSRSRSRITATMRRITAAGMGQPLQAACHTAVVRPAADAHAVPGRTGPADPAAVSRPRCAVSRRRALASRSRRLVIRP